MGRLPKSDHVSFRKNIGLVNIEMHFRSAVENLIKSDFGFRRRLVAGEDRCIQLNERHWERDFDEISVSSNTRRNAGSALYSSFLDSIPSKAARVSINSQN